MLSDGVAKFLLEMAECEERHDGEQGSNCQGDDAGHFGLQAKLLHPPSCTTKRPSS
jgi:hypothetical protein